MEHFAYSPTAFDGNFTLERHHNELQPSEITGFIQQLLSTIDLHKLTSLYFQHLQKNLGLVSVKLTFPTGSLMLGEENAAHGAKALEFTHQHQAFASAAYSFKHTLNIGECSILRELHDYFTNPLKNALEHYRLKQLAMKDHLTSLGNRASYQETLQRLISEARRKPTNFGLLVLDLDHFKQVNDRFGHQQGDNVLLAMAETLQFSLRDTDFAFRLGGDEFCCLLPESQQNQNEIVARRIMRNIGQHPAISQYGVSCSIGSATFTKRDSGLSLFERADRALYAAKNAGRSRIMAA